MLIKGCLEEITALIKNNKQIQDIQLEGCPILSEVVKAIVESLNKNTTLLQLTCGTNENDDDINRIEGFFF